MSSVTLRATKPSDAQDCARVMYAAFSGIAAEHGFPADFPSPDAAAGLSAALTADPSVFGVVAEMEGRIVGSNFLKEGDSIRGVGPITVDPAVQGSGLGRRLMQAVLERANGAEGVRLLQDGFNMRSLALYASLGFEVREPVVVMSGSPSGPLPAGAQVRPMQDADIAPCDAICVAAHGLSRRSDLEQAVRWLAPLVLERDGRVTAYMTSPTIWLANHGVAETEDDMRALILGAGSRAASVSFLLPIRQAGLFRWCLDQDMRAVKPMTLMTIGAWRTPQRPYMPSVFY